MRKNIHQILRAREAARGIKAGTSLAVRAAEEGRNLAGAGEDAPPRVHPGRGIVQRRGREAGADADQSNAAVAHTRDVLEKGPAAQPPQVLDHRR